MVQMDKRFTFGVLSFFTVFLFVSCFLCTYGIFKGESLNVNGEGQKKRAFITEMIKDKQISVCFLQETHTDERNKADWRLWWGEALSQPWLQC